MGPSFSSKQSSHQTKPNNKKPASTGFKQQRICIPLAPTRNKIIYKTACSDGPNSGSGKPSQNRLRSKGPPYLSGREFMPSFTHSSCWGCSFHVVEGASLRGIWVGLRRLTNVSPSSSFHPLFSVVSHGRVPAAGLLPQFNAWLFLSSEGVSCPGSSARSPGSWLGGSWVSALRIWFCLLLHCDLAMSSGWLAIASSRSL